MPLHPTDRRDLAASLLAVHLRAACLRTEGAPDAATGYQDLTAAERDMWGQRAKAVISFFTEDQRVEYFDLAVRLARQQGK